jgi:hypothetical protein
MSDLRGGTVQWKNAAVFVSAADGTASVEVPAYIDERAVSPIIDGLRERLVAELRYIVAVAVTGGNPGMVAIAGLKEPFPNPGVLSKAVRDAIDDGYEKTSQAQATAEEYADRVRGLDNSQPSGA